jgi:hypothetical protein
MAFVFRKYTELESAFQINCYRPAVAFIHFFHTGLTLIESSFNQDKTTKNTFIRFVFE